jgi:Zn-finger nucleic acid-binding protein
MQCPIDKTELTMSERQGIEIDYCSTCRGVWLDRGEIDKIIERSESHGQPAMQQRHEERRPESHEYRERDDDYHQSHGGYNQHHKKKESWFGELFD